MFGRNKRKPQAVRTVQKRATAERVTNVARRNAAETDRGERVLPRSFWLWRVMAAFTRLALPVALIFGLYVGGEWALPKISQAWLPVTYLAVEGDIDEETKQKVYGKAAPLLEAGLLLSNLSQVCDEVTKIAWIGGVDAKRIWPDTVQLTITRQKPVAKWATRFYGEADGKKQTAKITSEDALIKSVQLLLVDGQVVDMPAEIVDELDDANTKNNSALENKMAVYAAFDTLPDIVGSGVGGEVVVDELGRLQTLLARYDYQLTTLAVASYGGRSLLLKDTDGDALLIKLPRQDKFLVLEKFMLHAKRLFGLDNAKSTFAKKPASVDLRYQNGFAVTWGANAQQDDSAGLQNSGNKTGSYVNHTRYSTAKYSTGRHVTAWNDESDKNQNNERVMNLAYNKYTHIHPYLNVRNSEMNRVLIERRQGNGG